MTSSYMAAEPILSVRTLLGWSREVYDEHDLSTVDIGWRRLVDDFFKLLGELSAQYDIRILESTIEMSECVLYSFGRLKCNKN